MSNDWTSYGELRIARLSEFQLFLHKRRKYKNIHNLFCPKRIFADFQYVKEDKIVLLTVPKSSLSEFCPGKPIFGANFTRLRFRCVSFPKFYILVVNSFSLLNQVWSEYICNFTTATMDLQQKRSLKRCLISNFYCTL